MGLTLLYTSWTPFPRCPPRGLPLSLVHQLMCLRIRKRYECRHTRRFHPLPILYVITSYKRGHITFADVLVYDYNITVRSTYSPSIITTVRGDPVDTTAHGRRLYLITPQILSDPRRLRTTRRCLSLIQNLTHENNAAQSQIPNCKLEV